MEDIKQIFLVEKMEEAEHRNVQQLYCDVSPLRTSVKRVTFGFSRPWSDNERLSSEPFEGKKNSTLGKLRNEAHQTLNAESHLNLAPGDFVTVKLSDFRTPVYTNGSVLLYMIQF